MVHDLVKEIFILIIPLSVILIIISQCDCCRNKCRKVNTVSVQPIIVQASLVEGQHSIIVIAEPLQSCER